MDLWKKWDCEMQETPGISLDFPQGPCKAFGWIFSRGGHPRKESFVFFYFPAGKKVEKDL